MVIVLLDTHVTVVTVPRPLGLPNLNAHQSQMGTLASSAAGDHCMGAEWHWLTAHLWHHRAPAGGDSWSPEHCRTAYIGAPKGWRRHAEGKRGGSLGYDSWVGAGGGDEPDEGEGEEDEGDQTHVPGGP